MTAIEEVKRKCAGSDCDQDAQSLQCPTCQKLGKSSFFCGQDCFKRNWGEHKKEHKNQSLYDPYPTYPYTGPLRAVYPLSPRRKIPDHIVKPDYWETGIPKSEQNYIKKNKITVLNKEQQAAMRKVCRYTREVLDIAAKEVRPGITTDYLDEVVHKACIERNSYPSPLNYGSFPKSVCTSVNEIICHGIPDQYVLKDGDIVNIDVSLYHGGFHGDLNETYYVGEKAKQNPETVKLVETTREALDEAIKIVKPGMLIRDAGNIIEKYAKAKSLSVVRTYCGHGINELFHCAPNVPHYGKNKTVGEAKPGICFTIEPMIASGTYRDKTWPDNWTSATADGKMTAQFGESSFSANRHDKMNGVLPSALMAATNALKKSNPNMLHGK
ncbi:methionine aminopeptidase 1 [Microthyrium microscopicum]|uniref:Methionine aminopeptidase n=1 Tax=Microthyrium microscopicum TaxID=703497 RepID=A0A6A6U462_9PEZI|nr:methionine aminopeptidase 1 [Microthyrium microscopicum]